MPDQQMRIRAWKSFTVNAVLPLMLNAIASVQKFVEVFDPSMLLSSITSTQHFSRGR